MERPSVAEVVAFQADACARAGSPLYATVLDGVLADVRAGGPCADLLAPHAADPFGSALALRLLGAVHRIVLEGRAPDLAACYPSVGGRPDAGDPAAAFLHAVREHRAEVASELGAGVQTNEVGRAAALVGGFAAVAERTGLPLRVLEIGASAGLNLRWDRFAYRADDPSSPVQLAGSWEGDPPPLPAQFHVAERRGCDPHPIDATTPDGHRLLRSFVWPDQVDRLALLDAAVEVARRVPAPVDPAHGPEWLEAQLAAPAPGRATVVFHSIVLQYLARPDRQRVRDVVAAAGGRSTPEAPVAWLRMEPAGPRAEVRLTTWPGGTEELLATSGFHGRPVRWLT